VASSATVKIETRAQTGGDVLDLLEYILRGVEKIQLVLAQARNRAAGAGISAARTGVNRLLRGASSPGTATASPSATTAAATPVVWREILSEMVMQIEASAIPILRKSRSRQSGRPQHHGSDAGEGPPPCKLCHFLSPHLYE
jgi:hypothetical protein